MATDYQHCLMLMEELLPDEDWGRIYDEWGNFSDLDDGDNEPFALLRRALTTMTHKRAEESLYAAMEAQRCPECATHKGFGHHAGCSKKESP